MRKKVSPDRQVEREGQVKRPKQGAPMYGIVEQDGGRVKPRLENDSGRKGHGQSYRPMVADNMDQKWLKEERKERIAETRTSQHRVRPESEAVKGRWQLGREEQNSQLAKRKERVDSKHWDEGPRRPKRDEYERIVRRREEPKSNTREGERSKREGGGGSVSQAPLLRESKNPEKHRSHPDRGECKTLCCTYI